jgi:hypothetical protein
MTTNILAPFVKLDESFQFYVSGRLFEMNETEIKEVEGTQNSTLINAINAFESFQFTEDSVRWFHGPSKFIYNLAEGIFQHNNSEIIGSTFSNHIMAAGHIRYAEKPIAELFESLPTLLENFVTLDFAATFEGNEVTVNLFVLNEDVYVARFNKANKIAKFFKAKSANEAADYVTSETGESALLFLKEMVEGESAELAIKEEKLATYESMLSFLKDQKGLLANADRNDEAIKEAESLINGEIKVWEDKIAQLDEAVKFIDYQFNSHKNHNPDCDILQGHLDSDTFITYGIYVKDSGSRKVGDEFMEYYTGENYNVGSSKKSNSRVYGPDAIPAKYQAAWNELKSKYENEYK